MQQNGPQKQESRRWIHGATVISWTLVPTRMIGVRSSFVFRGVQTLSSDPGAFETAPVLGYDDHDQQPVRTPVPAESECLHN